MLRILKITTSIETLCIWPDHTKAYHVKKVGSCNKSEDNRKRRRRAARDYNEIEPKSRYLHVAHSHLGHSSLVAG